MNGFHSIWLLPAAADEALLQTEIDELALRFGTPRFRPHLTLVEDMNRSVDELAPLATGIGFGIAAFDAPVREIAAGDLHFRSFYALFDNAGPLRELKKRAIAAIAPGTLDEFMPHISLLYGVADGPQKRAAREAVAARHVGRRIGFDRVAVVAAAQEIPVADWAVRFSADLHLPPGS